MKKLILTGILFFTFTGLFACDICGCSAPGYFFGPFPQFKSHFYGVRYYFRSFNSQVKDDASQFSKDFYQTAEIWGGLNVGKKWQLMAFVPYNFNKQKSDDGTNSMNGIGDITLLANYKIINNSRQLKNGKNIRQQLMFGAGIKIPTGKFSADPDEIIAGANNQPGSGSVDVLLNSMYTLQINTWGVNGTVNYKINNSADQFRFGNTLNANLFAFKNITAKSLIVSPNVGLMYENLQANKLENLKVADTGGNALLGAAGVEINMSKITFGVNVQLPIDQNLSDGQTKILTRGVANVTFAF
ncbi:MAG: hypothetical protein WAU24_00610 [Chitinophagaceae bacterium]